MRAQGFIHCGHRRAVYRRKYRMDDPPLNEQPCRRREHGPQHQLVAVQPDRRKNPRLTCVGVGRKGLQKGGRALWRAMWSVFDFRAEPNLLAILEQACRTRDEIDRLEVEMDDQPYTVLGSARQVQVHPLVSEARFQRKALDEPRGGFVKLRSLRRVVELRRCQVVGIVFAQDSDVSRWQKLCEVPQIERIPFEPRLGRHTRRAYVVPVTRGLLWRRSPRSVEALWRLFGRFDTLFGMRVATFRALNTAPELRFWCGAPSGFRTPDPLIKSQLLYQLS